LNTDADCFKDLQFDIRRPDDSEKANGDAEGVTVAFTPNH
jgi:hypothetical protein